MTDRYFMDDTACIDYEQVSMICRIEEIEDGYHSWRVIFKCGQSSVVKSSSKLLVGFKKYVSVKDYCPF